METRQANLEGQGRVSARDLVRNALRMRPDRIIVGECRSDEAFDMLQAMNTGHDGSLTTIHANDTRDALSRLEMLVGMAGYDLPIWFIHRQLASAIQIVVQVCRLSGEKRKITKISEITGLEGNVIGMHDIFVFEQTDVDEDGHAVGRFLATGIRPRCLERFVSAGIKLHPKMFDRREMTTN
jgi:pilus assembly protein CpaF